MCDQLVTSFEPCLGLKIERKKYKSILWWPWNGRSGSTESLNLFTVVKNFFSLQLL